MTADWEHRLRDHGFRITPQRQLVLEAVEHLRHGTPEEILVEVQRTATGVNLSTIYRTLEVLEDVGLVTHAHIGHGPPTYHAVDEHVHIHLVCDRCGAVQSVPRRGGRGLRRAAGVRLRLPHRHLPRVRPRTLRVVQGRRVFEPEAGRRAVTDAAVRRSVAATRREPPTPGVPWHYGDPHARAAPAVAREPAVVDLSNRGVVTVSGPDRLSWLDDLTTQPCRGLASRRLGPGPDPEPARPRRARAPRRRRRQHDVDHRAARHRRGARRLPALACSSCCASRSPTGRTTSPSSGSRWEPDASGPSWLVPADFAGSGPRRGRVRSRRRRHQVRRRSAPPTSPGREVIVPRADLAARLAAADGLAGTLGAARPCASAAAVPRARPRDRPPHAARTRSAGSVPPCTWPRAATAGQEAVARVHNLGHPPRRLVLLHLDGSARSLPAHGDAVVRRGPRGRLGRHGGMAPRARAGRHGGREAVVPVDAPALVRVASGRHRGHAGDRRPALTGRYGIVELDRDRPVVRERHLHVRTEHPGAHRARRARAAAHDGVDQGLGDRAGSGRVPRRSPALAGVRRTG